MQTCKNGPNGVYIYLILSLVCISSTFLTIFDGYLQLAAGRKLITIIVIAWKMRRNYCISGGLDLVKLPQFYLLMELQKLQLFWQTVLSVNDILLEL